MTRAGRIARVAGMSGLLGALTGCVDKAPPPLWPAPPPPSVAEVIGAPAQSKAPPMPVGVVGAPSLAGPPSALDSVPVDKANILDPDGAAAEAAKANTPPPTRSAPTHR